MALTCEAIAAISAAVSAGTSVAQGMVAGCNHSIVAGIEVANCTKYQLEVLGYKVTWGQIQVPPTSVNPGRKEALLGHQTGACTTGTTGVAAWKVGDTGMNLVIMWSAPYNFNHHDNVLAIGFSTGTITLDKETVYEMYEKDETWFERKAFNCGASAITINSRSGRFRAVGIMGSAHKCEAKIEFQPLMVDDVAESLKSVVYRPPAPRFTPPLPHDPPPYSSNNNQPS